MSFLFTYTPLKFFIQSFWRDEAFSYVLAHKNIIDILVYTARDFNPPLYYIFLHIWMNIFGTSEIALRALSLVFFWATVYITFDFMHDVLNISYKKAVFYMGLIIINPILLYYAFEARMYTMLAFFAALSYYALHTKRKKMYMVAIIAGLYTHYFMILVVISQVIYQFLTRNKNTSYKKILRLYIWPVIFFLPWAVYVIFQKISMGYSFWINKVKLHELPLIPATLYTGMETYLSYYKSKPMDLFSLISISAVILFILTIGYIKIKRENNIEKRYLFFSLLIWAFFAPVLIFLISLSKPLFLPRYLIFSTPGMLLAIIYSLKTMNKNARMVLAGLLVILTIHHLGLQLSYHSKENIGKVIHEIKSLAKPNDVLYVTDVLDYFTAQYYFDEKRVFIYNKSYNEIPQFVGKALIGRDRIKMNLPYYPQKAFILKQNREYDISAMY